MRYRIFFIQILILILLLPGCFKKEELILADTNVSLQNTADGTAYISEVFGLQPGVYQVRLSAGKIEGENLYADVYAEQSYFRTLRCNGMGVYKGQKHVDFEAYVLGEIERAYVKLSASEIGNTVIEKIEIYRLNWGARMLAFCFVVGCLLIDGMLIFRTRILAGVIKKEQQVAFWCLLCSVLIAYYPYMTDYFSGATDIGFHWLRIEGLKETLLQGDQFPVRVQSYWLYDHGYAVSSFYGDLFLLIPVFFRLIGFSLMTAYKMFVFVMMAATAVIAYYSFKRCVKHTYAALFGSVLYVLAPYRIYNFYNQAAIGEALAMAFLPLVICGLYEFYTLDVTDKKYAVAKIPLIIGLSCILQSHLLTCEMVVIFMLLVALIFWKRTFRRQTFVQFLQAAVVCLLVNCWFWLPLLHMLVSDRYLLSTVIGREIQSKGTWFAQVFQLYPNQGNVHEGIYQGTPIQMGAASLIILVFVFIVLGRRYLLKKDSGYKNAYDKIMIFWAGLIFCSWLMSTCYFPWNLLAKIPVINTLVSALQFPTRLFALVSVFCAIAGSFFTLWFSEECKVLPEGMWKVYMCRGSILLLSVLAVGTGVYHVNDQAYLDEPVWLYTAENMGTASVVYGEYLLEGTTLDQYSYHDPVAEEGLEWSDYKKNGTTIWINVDNTTESDRTLELPLTGYKGYAVEAVTAPAELPYIAEERGTHGDLQVTIPGGYQGRLKIYYKGYTMYRIAEVLSFVTVVLVMAIWIKGRKRK